MPINAKAERARRFNSENANFMLKNFREPIAKGRKRILSVVYEQVEDQGKLRKYSSTAVPPKNSPQKKNIQDLKLDKFSLKLPEKRFLHEVLSPVLPPDIDPLDVQGEPSSIHVNHNYRYTKSRESKWVVDTESLIGDDPKLKSIRQKLLDWLIQIAHFFRISQETLYHSVSLIDRTLLLRQVSLDQYPLLAITCFLIACKLEEYAPPCIAKLITMTNQDYTPDDVLGMETEIVKLHDFVLYGPEPMIFMNRFILAAQKGADSTFKNIVLCIFDTFLVDKSYSQVLSSKLSAAAVLSALALENYLHEKSCEDLWSQNMAYYSEYRGKDLIDLSVTLLYNVLRAKSLDLRVSIKFSSVSRHENIWNSKHFTQENIAEAIDVLLKKKS